MASVELKVLRNGKLLSTVDRELHFENGKPFVRYKRQAWYLTDDNELHLDNPHRATREVTANEPVETIYASKGESEDSGGNSFQWDASQEQVITSKASARLLVGAGPGTGKTAVACARVCHLIDGFDLEPSNVWLVSFTRTAVNEIRGRIAEFSKDVNSASRVKVATIDSHAWEIHSGYDDNASIIGDYEENIRSVLNLIDKNELIDEYLESVEHLVVDEAQDIVGVRRDLILRLIGKLTKNCGVTVFSDDAQAIYGFAEDEENTASDKGMTLAHSVRQGETGDFIERELNRIHRTKNENLVNIFSNVRREVLSNATGGKAKLVQVEADVMDLAHGDTTLQERSVIQSQSSTFVLFRRRIEVLTYCSFLMGEGIPHRIRMSGLPICLDPWIGLCLAEYGEPLLSRSRFFELWSANVVGTPWETLDRGDCWSQLIGIASAGRHQVEMNRLREVLGRYMPPTQFGSPELGTEGPIVGTIHASKGREADTVILFLPQIRSQKSNHDEEARVVFVGATRGRSCLYVGSGYPMKSSRTELSRRTFRPKISEAGSLQASIEIGRENDVGAEGLAGKRFFNSAAAVRRAQNRVKQLATQVCTLTTRMRESQDYRYHLSLSESGPYFAVLSNSVNQDLWEIAKQQKIRGNTWNRRPPTELKHIYTRGIRTIVLQPSALELAQLHEPWKSSGIMLAPVLYGFAYGFFPRTR